MHSVADAERVERASWRVVTVVVLATLLAYLPSVFNGYVWDDVPLVVLSDRFEQPFSLLRMFQEDLWAGAAIGDSEASGYYRPLMVLGLWLDHWTGAGAAGAHLHSLMWHVAAIVTCAWLGLRVGGPKLAWMGALWLAVHPLQTEAVLWVAARNDLMAAAFGMASLAVALGPRRPRMALGSGALALLAGLCKESVLLLPLLLGVLAWVALPGPRNRSWWADVLKRVAPLLVGIGLVMGLRVAANVDAARGPTALGWSLLWQEAPRLLGLLGVKVVAPWPLSTGYAIEYIDRLPAWWLAGGGVGGVLLAAFVIWRGRVLGVVGLAWAGTCAAPAVWAVATTGWMGERYLYLSFAGLGWAIAASTGARGRLGVGLLVGILGLGSVALRTADWRTDETLWESAWMASPSPFTAVSLGHAVRGAGDTEAALDWFVRALDDPEPPESACEPLMGTALAHRKMLLAVQLGHWAAGRGCESDTFRGRFAISLASTAQWAELARLLDVVEGNEDPAGRLVVARATLARVEGDTDAYAQIAQAWQGELPLDAQVDAIVDNAARFSRSPSGTLSTPIGEAP